MVCKPAGGPCSPCNWQRLEPSKRRLTSGGSGPGGGAPGSKSLGGGGRCGGAACKTGCMGRQGHCKVGTMLAGWT